MRAGAGRRRAGRRGQALVEVAIALPLLMVLLVGVAQVGLIYYVQMSVTGAAREGARVAAANPGGTKLFSSPYSPSAPRNQAITAVTNVGTTVTATVASTAGMFAGEPLLVAGVTGFTTNNPNGSWVVAGVTGATTFAFGVTSAPTGHYLSGGTVTRPYVCTGATDPILACQAAFDSTQNALGGLINPANLSVALSGATFPGTTSAACPGKTGSTSDGLVSVMVSYNAPVFIPFVGNLFATAGNAYRTVTFTTTVRVEPCNATNGG